MTKFKLFVAAIAISTAFATPALAQWQSQEPWQAQEPGQYAAQYPNRDPAVAMVFVPSMTKSPRHMMPHAVRVNS
jgi:hypothetical protein